MKKRIISFIIAVLLVFIIFPLPSFAKDADSNACKDHVFYAEGQSNCAYLKGIDITSGAEITPAFIRTKYNYTVLLDEYTESVTITPLKENDGAILTIGGAGSLALKYPLLTGNIKKYI